MKTIIRTPLLVIAIALISIGGIHAIRSIFQGQDLLVSQDSSLHTGRSNRYPILGIMIENEVSSRKFQKGLSQAQIVYEAPAEAGITRFLAIYDGGNYALKMGPVRSARPYFVDWIHEYSLAVYAHVGGSAKALSHIANTLARDADQYNLSAYFKRENVGKTAYEHTMFTGEAKMERLIRDKDWDTVSGPTNVLKNHFKIEEGLDFSAYPAVSKISIPFGTKTYKVDYQYDTALGKFVRSQAGKPHIDTANKENIAPKTVIVQYANIKNNNDKAGTITLKTTGAGEAVIFTMGKAIPATWSKTSMKEPTKFTLKDSGAEVVLPDGQVWIEILSNQSVVTYQ